MCQSKFSMITAATGSPIAAPMQRVELISAIEDSTRSAGNSSRMMLMPRGMTAGAAPCNAADTTHDDPPPADEPDDEPADVPDDDRGPRGGSRGLLRGLFREN